MSSVVSAYYDQVKKELTVKMANNPPKSHGEVLTYRGVPESVYRGLIKASSKGHYFNTEIRNVYQLVH